MGGKKSRPSYRGEYEAAERARQAAEQRAADAAIEHQKTIEALQQAQQESAARSQEAITAARLAEQEAQKAMQESKQQAERAERHLADQKALIERLTVTREEDLKVREAIQQQLRLLEEELKRARELKSAEEVREAEDKGFKALLKIVQKLPPTELAGEYKVKFNSAYFGNTSVGKSTLINYLLGEKKAKTGRGETTKHVEPYVSQGAAVLWDFPGKNDQVDYYTEENLSLAKAMTCCFCIFSATYKECSRYIAVLASMNVPFYVVISKVDEWDASGELEQLPGVIAETEENLRQFGSYKGVLTISTKEGYLNRPWNQIAKLQQIVQTGGAA